jgi:hypothetical protein
MRLVKDDTFDTVCRRGTGNWNCSEAVATGSSTRRGIGWHGAARLRHRRLRALTNAGHDTRSLQAYLGPRNIQHVRYTELVPDRFKDFWR